MKNHSTHPVLSARLALALAGLALASACVSKPRGQAQNTYVGGEGKEMESRVGNRGLERDLDILRPMSRRDESGRLQVQFELHNKKTSDFAFEYSVVWRDAAGFVVPTPWHWTPMSIVGQGYRTVSVTGPTPEACQWELHVQKPSAVR